MKIEVFCSPDCSSGEPLLENVREALSAEHALAEISLTKIGDEQAASLGLSGSPSVLIDSVELQASESSGFS
jgi:hypothetical protein